MTTTKKKKKKTETLPKQEQDNTTKRKPRRPTAATVPDWITQRQAKRRELFIEKIGFSPPTPADDDAVVVYDGGSPETTLTLQMLDYAYEYVSTHSASKQDAMRLVGFNPSKWTQLNNRYRKDPSSDFYHIIQFLETADAELRTKMLDNIIAKVDHPSVKADNSKWYLSKKFHDEFGEKKTVVVEQVAHVFIKRIELLVGSGDLTQQQFAKIIDTLDSAKDEPLLLEEGN